MSSSNTTKIDHAWYVKYSYSVLKNVLGPFFRLIWIRKVDGLENIPKIGPVLVAFNHQSFFDFLCFIAISPRPVHFLSAEKFFEHVIWRPLMHLTGQIKVHRVEHDKHLLHATVYHHLKSGKVIGIFPEGTRAPNSEEMLKAFNGVAKYAVVGMVPVLPVGIRGTYEVMSKFDKVPKFKKIISIHIGKPIHFIEHHGKDLSDSELKKLTDCVMLEISKLSGKKYLHAG